MITVSISGGLGNQLFQYATAKRLSIARNVPLALDLSYYDGGFDKRPKQLRDFARRIALGELCISARIATSAELAHCKDTYISASPIHRAVRAVHRFIPKFLCPASHVREGKLAFDPRVMELPDNCYLDGYCQSWKYFVDIRDVLMAEFRPTDPIFETYARSYLSRLKSSYGSIVSLHVRRGDLAYAAERLNNVALVQNAPLGLDYIHAAIRRFSSDCVFLVFSDTPEDREWCRSHIHHKNLLFSEAHSDLQDFILMSKCDHNIIANSTFSWWAAWLNPNQPRRVVCPKRWFAPGSRHVMLTEDLMPQEWETI
jgi:hypothetical protein